MLFARFLAENGLLIEPQEHLAISLAEGEELAKEDGVRRVGPGRPLRPADAAAHLPPRRPAAPGVASRPSTVLKLETLLAALPPAVFTADDALGWVYQFWQSKKKDEVNRSEVKIGADEICRR